ncbi:MAG: indole-3-glycerol phosphate synthase TrpC [Candidatus Calescibacterium sp.]|nr:indole-3-glycerol phosphate synthase TrpC [Candidatus Calescibacterium sp.]MCX7733802.1 indole-3-glycerol phosphate synthase TrpC [bacterium]MDW8086992.1 indole-3-glycerol phosphate synthase TrpC [Candidatus Calescibacterium sp.]
MSFLLNYIEIKKKKNIVKRELFEVKRKLKPISFTEALEKDSICIIAEVKRASPSAGIIKLKDAVSCAKEYEEGGADAISVLTEKEYFGGDIEDLKSVSEIVKIPVLRKDFILDKDEIYESYIIGADSYLLISECFESYEDIEQMIEYGRNLGMEPLLEFFSDEGGNKAVKTSAKIIGINNRNLHTLEVDLKKGIELFEKFRNKLDGKIVVSESGIKSKKDIDTLVNVGITRFLIGETLMKSSNPGELIREFKANKK